MAKYSIKQDFHSVKKKDIWLVKPNDKLEYSDYKKLESKIKIIGGYYSRFSRSFVFESEPNIDKLNEAFGDTATVEEKAQTAGVPQGKLALIELGSGFHAIDKRTLKKEYDARKLLVAQTSFYDGMWDSSRSIPESGWKWSDRDPGFEREFDYSKKPYASYGHISFGDYRAKYKEDIVQPVKAKSSNQSSLNYYVDVDEEKKANEDDKYSLDRVDSKSEDHEKGARVVMSIYGNKYCGFITNKKINIYQTTMWGLTTGNREKTVEDHRDVYYEVTLDNGAKQNYATFKIDTDNECEEVSADAIFKNNDFVLPEQFWTFEIVREINSINSLKKQKSARKKAEYAQQDQKWIDRNEVKLMRHFAIWLGWEQKNKIYSREITGESETEQEFRINKWMQEYNVVPQKLLVPKSKLINKLIRANNLLLNQINF